MGAVKRVAFVTDFFPKIHRKWFGAEIACMRLKELLSGGGRVRVDLYTSRADFPGEIGKGTCEVPLIEDSHEKLGLSLKTAVPFDPRVYRFFRRAFRQDRPDIVHLHNIKRMSFAPLVAARALSIPVVFSVYDNWSFCPENALVDRHKRVCTRFGGPWCVACVPLKKKPFVPLRAPVFRYFLKKVDRFLVLTRSERENFTRYGVAPERIETLPLPLFPGLPEPDASGVRPRSILIVGRVEHGKGLHVLIEAMPGVLERFPDARVDVVGDHSGNSNYRLRAEARIKELGIEGAFVFHGKKGNEEVKGFLSRANVVAVPEQWSIAWPIFLTEAMAMGKVIVASRIGDIPEFIEEGRTGFLAEPVRPACFTEKINRALEQGSLVNRAAAERIRSLCDADRIRAALIDAYGRALGRTTATPEAAPVPEGKRKAV